MTSSVTANTGRLTLNNGLITTANTNIKVATNQYFSYHSGTTLVGEIEVINTVATNATAADLSFGFMGFSGLNIVDGAYFQFNGATQTAVTNWQGVVITTKDISAGGGGVNLTSNRTRYRIELNDEGARFFINDKIVADMANASNAATKPNLNPALQYAMRINIGANASAAAPTLQVGSIYIGHQDGTFFNLPGNHLSVYAGNGGYQGQTGNTMGSTQSYPNSGNPTAVLPTNTTAALGSGLGGQFWETDTLASPTDGIIQSFQNPAAGGSNNIGKTLLIYGVTIQSVVATALTAGGYTASWSLAFGHTAVSLATTETLGTSKAPRRIGLGFQVTPANAPVHTTLPSISMRFDGAPLVVHPGEFIQAVKKKMVGTAPTAGTIGHIVTYDCIWV
jgi:hypothetical protein